MKKNTSWPDNYNPLLSKYINADKLSLQLIPKNSIVLEIGCSSGYLGKIMKQHLNCKVIGVEKDKQAGQKAKKHLDKIIIGNLENKNILTQIKKYAPFDVIFASAVLEHLLNPDSAIQILNKYLKPKGFFIITLPNVAHYTARLSILKGNFQYTDSGIFDKTHLHFYSQKTARELLEKNKLNIIFEDYEFFGPKPISLLFNIFPNLFAYQFIFKAKTKKY